jgi:hypothetical protein
MIRSVWFGIALLVGAFPQGLVAQLDAPMASSSFGACTQDGCMWVPEFAKQKVYRRGDLAYLVQMLPSEQGGTFVLRRDRKVLLTTPLKDLSASVSVVWSQKNDWFAVTWSDGGAVGGFHTRVFHIAGDEVRETRAVDRAFQDFRSRHSCKARGENVQAYRWDEANEALVLVMSVYPASDCGKEMGHTEAYFVQPADGGILHHVDLAQLKAYMKTYP